MAKMRVNLYLDEDIYRKAKSLVEQVPGSSVSGLVDEVLEGAIPMLEQTLEAAKAGDTEAQAKMMSHLFANQLLKLANESVGVIRTIKGSDKKTKAKRK